MRRRFATGLGLAATALLVAASPALASSATFVRDIYPGSTGSNLLNIADVGGGVAYLAATHGSDGQELWRSDGTTAGTKFVRDIDPGISSASPGGFMKVGGTVLFAAFTGTYGTELWRTDGTAAGTKLVRDIYPGETDSYPASFVNIGGTLYFSADDGTHGRELWRSDGTAAGTELVRNIRPDGGTNKDSSPSGLTNLGGTLFFAANDGTHGVELWRSDGTASGTELVRNIKPDAAALPGSTPRDLTDIDGTLYFRANDRLHGVELWRSDGTGSGTNLVRDINPGAGDSNPENFTSAGGTIFFTADDGTHGEELWRSNGMRAGTKLARDIYPGSASSDPFNLAATGGTLLFSADDGAHGTELWRSDGTTAGTELVRDIRPGAQRSSPEGLTNVGGTVFFSANDLTHGRELWSSDGTTAGTELVRDIKLGGNPGTFGGRGSVPQQLTNVGGTLLFSANDGTHGSELWKAVP